MPSVSTTVFVGNIALKTVWSILVDFERYPVLMHDVEEVVIIERHPDTIISDWKVLLNGSLMTWREKDRLEENRRIIFEQIEGDLMIWNGIWEIKALPDGVYVSLDINFDIGIPSLADILNPIGEQAIRNNSKQMLDVIREESRNLARFEN